MCEQIIRRAGAASKGRRLVSVAIYDKTAMKVNRKTRVKVFCSSLEVNHCHSTTSLSLDNQPAFDNSPLSGSVVEVNSFRDAMSSLPVRLLFGKKDQVGSSLRVQRQMNRVRSVVALDKANRSSGPC